MAEESQQADFSALPAAHGAMDTLDKSQDAISGEGGQERGREGKAKGTPTRSLAHVDEEEWEERQEGHGGNSFQESQEAHQGAAMDGGLAREAQPSSMPHVPKAEQLEDLNKQTHADAGIEEMGMGKRERKEEEAEEERSVRRYGTIGETTTLAQCMDSYIAANSVASGRLPMRQWAGHGQLSYISMGDVSIGSRRHQEAKALEQLLRKPRYHDWCCTMLFLLHLAAVLIALALGLYLQSSWGNLQYLTSQEFLTDVVVPFLKILAASTLCGFVAGAFTMLWFFLLRRFVRATLWTSYSLAVFVIFLSAMQSFLTGLYFVGCVVLIVFALFILLGIVLAKRMAFTIVLLRIGVVLMDMMPGIKNFALFSILVYMAWFTLWFACVLIIFQFDVINDNSYVHVVVSACFALSLFWTTLVIKNVVHTTACGVFSTWYFMQNSPHFPRRPTLDAARRTLTYSFGSVCFAALVSALITTARVTVGWLWSDAWRGLCSVALVCSSLVQWLARYGNRYAQSYMATYGTNYLRSCKDTAVLLKHNGLDALLNDSAVSVSLLVASVLSGILSGCLGFVMGIIFGLTDGEFWVFVILTIIVGAAVNLILLALIISAIVTLFVCISEDPEILKETFPELYNKLASAYLEHESKAAAKQKQKQAREKKKKAKSRKRPEATPLLAE